MRALVVERPAPAAPGAAGPLQLVDLPDPVAGPGEVVIRVSACGVCRTDLQIAEGDIATRRLPIVLGHQPVGRVESVGPGVNGWAVGDRAGAGWFGGSCGT